MNAYFVFILSFMIVHFAFNTWVELLNVRAARSNLPEEFAGIYDADKYAKSQDYLKTTTRFGLISGVYSLLITLSFWLSGGFNWLDLALRSLGLGNILTGILFIASLNVASTLLKLPFSVYRTFRIEERFGFNRTTPKTFVQDLLKGLLLSAIIGLPILSLVLWFFEKTGSAAWLYCWAALTVIQLILMFVAPVLIMPLFNKFEPMEDGELKEALTEYANKQNFQMQGLYTMDGSKRSSKSNAYFTGFGKFRRIVLFDTLIEKHTTEELVAILAHEMGHYKMKHIYKGIAMSIATSGLSLYVLSLFLNNAGLFAAFQMEHLSIYASLCFFGFIYAPMDMILGILGAVRSRKHEFEADAYSAETYGKPEALISGLKRLSVENLSNLTPHPLKVFLSYSHPPVLERIKAIQRDTY